MRPAWEGPFFRHEGTLRWRCATCREEGSGLFKVVTVTGGEEIWTRDLDEVLCLAEAEHAVACRGSLEICGFHKRRHVEYIRANVSFGKDGKPAVFVVDLKNRSRRYEPLTTYEPSEGHKST